MVVPGFAAGGVATGRERPGLPVGQRTFVAMVPVGQNHLALRQHRLKPPDNFRILNNGQHVARTLIVFFGFDQG